MGNVRDLRQVLPLNGYAECGYLQRTPQLIGVGCDYLHAACGFRGTDSVVSLLFQIRCSVNGRTCKPHNLGEESGR